METLNGPFMSSALPIAGFAIIEVPLNSPQPVDSIRRLASRFGRDVLPRLQAHQVKRVPAAEAVPA